MASTYTRKDSPFIWMRFRDGFGKWRGTSAQYFRDNADDREKAEQLAKAQSRNEKAKKYVGTPGNSPFRKHLNQLSGLIYFFRSGELIKIGWSKEPASRLRELSTGNPNLELVATMEGNRKSETELHRRFSHLRHKGEWFRFDDEIKDFIKAICPYSI